MLLEVMLNWFSVEKSVGYTKDLVFSCQSLTVVRSIWVHVYFVFGRGRGG